MTSEEIDALLKELPPEYINQEALFDVDKPLVIIDEENKPTIDLNKAVIQKTKVISRPPLTDEQLDEISENASMEKAKDDGSLDYVINPLLASEIPGEGSRLFYEDRARRMGVKPIRLQDDAELDAIIADKTNSNYENALNEKGLRLRFAKQDFWTNVRDPDYVKRNAERDLKALISGPLKIPSAMMYTAGILATPLAQGLKYMGFDQPAKIVEKVLEGGDYANKKVNEALSTTDPQNPLETLAELTLPALMRIPLPGKILGGPMGQMAEFMTPLTVGPGAMRPAANLGAQFLGSELLRPLIAPEGDNYQTVFQQFFGSGAADAKSADPELDKVIGKTPEGADIYNSDLSKLSMLGLGMIAAGVAPGLLKLLPKKPVPLARIIDATGTAVPKTLETIETASDVAKVYLSDPVSGQFAIMKKAGIDDKGLYDAIEDTSMANQRGRIKSASETGVMRTIDGDFTSPISPNRLRRAYEGLAKDIQELAATHAKLKDLLDTMREQRAKFGGGMRMKEVIKRIQDIEKAHPEIVELHNGFKAINKANLDFMASGESALITAEKHTKLSQNRPNYARWENEDVDPSMPLLQRMAAREEIALRESTGIYDDLPFLRRRELPLSDLPRVNPYDSIVRSTEQVLKAKLDNANRLRTIKAMEKSPHGERTVAEVSKKDLETHPEWEKRTHRILENGKVRYFVMSKLMHDVLHYDANLPRHPYLFQTSRMFQFHTTGAGAPWFAPKQFLRTAWLQQITTPPGFKTLRTKFLPGSEYIHALGGILSQERWRAQRGLANALYKASDSGSNILFQTVFGDKGKKAMRVLADVMAHSYMNSSYHAVMSHGLHDISMSQNAIKQARGMLDEITRNKQLPSQIRAAGHTWAGFLDSIQNGANYAWAVKNSDKGWAKAAKEAKKLSGDISVSGKMFTKGREPITGDLVSPHPGLTTFGRVVNVAREASPWTNSTIQSFRKLGMSYWSNPWKFMARLQVNFLMPAAAAYFYTAARGPKFTEYAYVQRGEYEKSTSIYIPNPASDDPADGFEIPIPLEIAPLVYMFQNALDVFYRPTVKNQGMLMSDQGGVDGSTMASTIMENFFDLTMPPIVSAGAAVAGLKTPGTVLFGEGAYAPKDPTPGAPVRDYLPHNVEMTIRAIMGSASDVYIQSINSYLSSEDVLTGIIAGAKEAAYQIKKKTPLISSRQLHSWTNISNESYALSDKLKEMADIKRMWIAEDENGKAIVSLTPTIRKDPGANIPAMYEQVDTDAKGIKEKGNVSIIGYTEPLAVVKTKDGFTILPALTKAGKVKTDGAIAGVYKRNGKHFGIFDTKEEAEKYVTNVKAAEEKAKQIAPELEGVPNTMMGLPTLTKPTNPLYIQFAPYLYERFEKDGDNYTKMTRMLSMLNDQEKTIRQITTGSLPSWKKQIDDLDPTDPVKQWFAGLDMEDRDSVREAINILETKKVQTLERIKLYVKETEDRMNQEIQADPILSQKIKSPIRLIDLDPYASP